MDRRAWLVAVLGAPVAFAHAQSPRRPRVGVLLHGTPATYSVAASLLREGLAERGYIEPKTLELIFRFSDGAADRLPALAHELVAAEVDILVTSSTPAIRAALAATRTIPIVFFAVADAVGSGLVASLARPGANATGLTLLIPDLGAKQLELLGDLVSGLRRVAVLRGRGEGAQAFDSIAGAATVRGVDARFIELGSPDDIAYAFATVRAASSQAIIVVDGPLLNNHGARRGPGPHPPAADHLDAASQRRRWFTRLVWTKPRRDGAPCRDTLCGPYPQGLEACRPTGGTAEQVRVRHQSQDCQGARHHHPAVVTAARRRVDRVSVACR